MREIKYRAWDKKENEMCIVDKLTFMFESETGIMVTVVGNHDDDEEITTDLFPEQFELMQYTGLKDKNGKEIYEGDFLIDGDSEPMRHRIVWYDDQAKFELETLADNDGNWDSHLIDELWDLVGKDKTLEDFEIIGNIYENPELIK